MGVKMDLTIITKNQATNPEKGFLAKSISMPNGCASAMATAWELGLIFSHCCGGSVPPVNWFSNMDQTNIVSISSVVVSMVNLEKVRKIIDFVSICFKLGVLVHNKTKICDISKSIAAMTG